MPALLLAQIAHEGEMSGNWCPEAFVVAFLPYVVLGGIVLLPALLVCAFFIGYYVGKKRERADAMSGNSAG